MSEEKKRALSRILKNAEKGIFDMDEFVKRTPQYIDDSNASAALQEDALSKLSLEQYKGRVPNQSDSPSKRLDFMEGLREQFMPESKAKLELATQPKGQVANYYPDRDLVSIDPKRPIDQLPGDLFHDLGHGVDLKKGDYGDINKIISGPQSNSRLAELFPDEFDIKGNAKNPRSLLNKIKSTDIGAIQEVLQKGHHGLKRGATFGKANLPKLLKGLTVSSLAGVGLKGLGAASLGALSLSAEAADVESSGASPDTQDYWMEKSQSLKRLSQDLLLERGIVKFPDRMIKINNIKKMYLMPKEKGPFEITM